MQLSIEAENPEKNPELFDKMAVRDKITMPLENTFRGAKPGRLLDKFGLSWIFYHEVKK